MRGPTPAALLAALLALGAGALGAPAPAGAAELVTITTPSRHVDPSRTIFNGPAPDALRANVLLPDGYDGRRRFPVLYLLHGIGDTYRTWAQPDRGNIAEIARGLGAIVVMPEAGRGFYTNWWNGGRRGDPGWERFYLDELIPLIEERFAVLPGRRHHAIAGLSMGGLGSAFLASQRPDYFGSAAAFSGFVQHQRPEVAVGLRALGGPEYEDVFGPMDAAYATGHNPTRLVGNLRHTRLFVAVGDGTARPGVDSGPSAVVGGGAVELGLRVQNEELVAAARDAGVAVTYRPRSGVHDWPYWREHLRDAIRWGLFADVPEQPSAWRYRTVAGTGRMWDLTYAFAAPPSDVVEFSRDGDVLAAEGSGTVTIAAGAGCSFTAALPFRRTLPARCVRPAPHVAVSPRRVRRGARSTFRVRVLREAAGRRLPVAGATVRLGRARARTDAGGRAVLALRLVGRPGLRRVRVSAPGLPAAAARVRVLRRR